MSFTNGDIVHYSPDKQVMIVSHDECSTIFDEKGDTHLFIECKSTYGSTTCVATANLRIATDIEQAEFLLDKLDESACTRDPLKEAADSINRYWGKIPCL